MKFLPDEFEQPLITAIQEYTRNEYGLVRMTKTMINKSTIDASRPLYKVIQENQIFDYKSAIDGVKTYLPVLVTTESGPIKINCSFYRPKAKKGKPGDPRLWPSKLHNFAPIDTLIYVTHHNSQLILIPLAKETITTKNLQILFGPIDDDSKVLHELLVKIAAISGDWIESCAPKNKNDKDVGDTLEKALGIPVNNLKNADYKGKIEIKSKRKVSGTHDTLFSMVPKWTISNIKSVKEMILTYGYKSNSTKKPTFIDLYCTVNTKPNPQGLYLLVDESNARVTQLYTKNRIQDLKNDFKSCHWPFDLIESRLQQKHPKTAWIVAEEKKISGKIHFKYISVEVTEKPIFSQFIYLIAQNYVTYDWRGGQDTKSNKKDDYGHPFRLNPKQRHLLFGKTHTINLEKYKSALN